MVASRRCRNGQPYRQDLPRGAGANVNDAVSERVVHLRPRLDKLPELPLHDNDMELAARRRVRKRDMSFGPQSRASARAWNSFQTIAATAAKLSVGLFHYLRDRLGSPETTPSLAERIAERTHLAAQPAG